MTFPQRVGCAWVALMVAALSGCGSRKDSAAARVEDSRATGGLQTAQSLAGASAARQGETSQALDREWAALAGTLPDTMTELQVRIDELRNRPVGAARGIDLDAARGELAAAESLWSKAQAAFATGNMVEAVATAQRLRPQLDALAAVLQIPLAAPAPEAPAT